MPADSTHNEARSGLVDLTRRSASGMRLPRLPRVRAKTTGLAGAVTRQASSTASSGPSTYAAPSRWMLDSMLRASLEATLGSMSRGFQTPFFPKHPLRGS